MNERKLNPAETLPEAVETVLREHVGSASEMPWMRLRVESQVEYRERARHWMSEHPRGLLQPRRQYLGTGVGMLLAVIAASVLGFWLGLVGPAVLQLTLPPILPYVSGGLTGLAVLLAFNWPRWKQYYR